MLPAISPPARAEMISAFRVLDLDMALELLARRSQTADVEWARAAVEAGVLANPHLSPSGLRTVLPFVNLGRQAPVFANSSPTPINTWVLEPKPWMHEWLDVVAHGVEAGELSRGARVSVRHLATALIVAAIAVDDRHQLSRLLQAYPAALNALTHRDTLPRWLSGAAQSDQASGLTAYGIAIALGRHDCMTVLRAHYRGDTMPVAGDGDIGTVGATRFLKVAALNARPESLALALKHQLTADAARLARMGASPPTSDHYQFLLRDAWGAMKEEQENEDMRYVGAYLEAGVYDLAPAISFEQAISHGQPTVVRHFRGRVPWAETNFTTSSEKSPMMQAHIDSQMNSRVEQYEEAMMAAVELAEEDGQVHRVLHQFVIDKVGGEVVPPHERDIAPLSFTVGMRFHRLLAKTLEHGLEPEVAMAPGVRSPLAVAEQLSEEGAALMRSWMARNKLDGLFRKLATGAGTALT
ncbi:hypothetical protein ACSFA0_25235 [Variovorax sp. LT1P1]|uniref:hypothetical protein n=1 Tax=Variovorax sp. LT1P1 TaxID=3443730 RepID=UPI003F4810BD